MEAQATPPVLYHYTNDAGLKGILDTGKLWLTSIFDLNYPSELNHGFSRAVEILKTKAANGPRAAQMFPEDIETFGLKGGVQRAAHYFISSFSSRGDDLGQWRAYADNGRGYALGFESRLIEDGFTKDRGVAIPNNSAFHVSYQDHQLTELLSEIIEHVFGLISMPRGRKLFGAVFQAPCV